MNVKRSSSLLGKLSLIMEEATIVRRFSDTMMAIQMEISLGKPAYFVSFIVVIIYVNSIISNL